MPRPRHPRGLYYVRVARQGLEGKIDLSLIAIHVLGMYIKYNNSKFFVHLLVTVQDDNLGLGLSNALEAQHVASVDSRNECSVALSQHSVLSAVQPDLGAAVLAHGDVDVHVPLRRLLRRAAASHSPVKALAHADDARAHDKVRVDGDRVGESGLGSRFSSGVGARSGFQRRQYVYEPGALGLLIEGARVVAWGEAAGPW